MQKQIEINSAEIKFWVEEQMPALVEMLTELCRIKSVAQVKDAEVKPFGAGCIEVLQKLMEIGEREGFETRNFDDYVCSVTYPGKTKENIGIWTHLDVVHEGEDWDYAPFEPTVKDGYMIARGCNDNKSSTAIGMFVLKYMKEHGIKLNHTLELYGGTCEEYGMHDLDYFVKHYECPTLSLVPDSGFPVCCGERGSFNGELIFEDKCEDLLEVECNGDLYTVPDKAEAVLRFDEKRWEKCVELKTRWSASGERNPEVELGIIQENSEGSSRNVAQEAVDEAVRNRENVGEGDVEFSVREGVFISLKSDGIHIKATGISTQAAIPEKGDSALTKLAVFLCENELLPEAELEIFRMVWDINNATHNGAALNVVCADELSGPMKLVATKLKMREIQGEASKEDGGVGGAETECKVKYLTISFISKYPFSKNDFPFEENARAAAAGRGFELKATRIGKATFFNPNRPVVKRLTDCCNRVLGTNDAPFIMSGGTYARKLPNALAFGTGMRVPKAPEGMFRPGHGSYHQPDESISLERVQKALEVYIHAILEIDGMDLRE